MVTLCFPGRFAHLPLGDGVKSEAFLGSDDDLPADQISVVASDFRELRMSFRGG